MEVESGVLKLNCKMICYYNNDLILGLLFLKFECCEFFLIFFKEGVNLSFFFGNNVICNFDLYLELFGICCILI